MVAAIQNLVCPSSNDVCGGEEEDIPTVKLSLENSIQDLDICFVSTEPIHKLLTSSSSSESDPALVVPGGKGGAAKITVVRVVETVVSQQPLLVPSQMIPSSSPFLQRRRPAFISATVHKKDELTMLGIGFKKFINQGNHHLRVSSIRPNCLLSDSPFQLGDKLISINNVDCTKSSLSTVAKMLKRTTGFLTVVMEHIGGDPQLVESMIIKETPNSKTGLGVSSFSGGGGISISSIDAKGIFASSLLSPQDRIFSINGNDCRCLPIRQAAELISNANDKVTIVAKKGTDNAAVVLLK